MSTRETAAIDAADATTVNRSRGEGDGGKVQGGRARTHGYRTLWLIVGMLLLPFVLASVLYASGWRPEPRPRGELLAAPVPVVAPAVLDGRWGLALLSGGDCDNACLAELDTLRRVQVASYKGMPHVRRLWLADAGSAVGAVEELHARWPDLALVVAGTAARQLAMPAARPVASHAEQAEQAELAERNAAVVLLVAPDGRALLRYPTPLDASALLHDLRRVLGQHR